MLRSVIIFLKCTAKSQEMILPNVLTYVYVFAKCFRQILTLSAPTSKSPQYLGHFYLRHQRIRVKDKVKYFSEITSADTASEQYLMTNRGPQPGSNEHRLRNVNLLREHNVSTKYLFKLDIIFCLFASDLRVRGYKNVQKQRFMSVYTEVPIFCMQGTWFIKVNTS